MSNPAAVSRVMVEGLEPRLTARDARAWWLDVVWRFHNPTDQPLHVLTAGPQSMSGERPLVINETATDHPAIDGNITPAMEFVVVAPGSTFDHRRRYALPPLAGAPPWPVVARFAVSHAAPDPVWIAGRAWPAVAAWQDVLESAPLQLQE